jgi:hypothetical protein
MVGPYPVSLPSSSPHEEERAQCGRVSTRSQQDWPCKIAQPRASVLNGLGLKAKLNVSYERGHEVLPFAGKKRLTPHQYRNVT